MKRIAIVGGGSAGLVALKYLKETPEFQQGDWELIAFEQRDDIGGIWLPEDSPPASLSPLPNSDPDNTNVPSTPLYNSLTTNLPHPIMAFRDFSFPPSTPLYPPASTVLQYLRDYAKTFKLEQFIRLSTIVDNVEWNLDEKMWTITATTREKRSDLPKTKVWSKIDTLILANGRHGYPYIPTTINRLDEWLELGKATHSMMYREPSPYTNKVVLVIGNGSSARDIAPEVSTVATKVYRSSRAKPINNPWDREYDVEVCGEVESLESLGDTDGDGRKVTLKDGRILEGIQAVIVATGYRFSYRFFPPTFLHSGSPPLSPSNETGKGESKGKNDKSDRVPSMQHLYNPNQHVWPLSLHMIPITPSLPNGSLFFLGLPTRPIVPFPFFEAQVRLIRSLLSLSKPIILDRSQQIDEVTQRYKELSDLASKNQGNKNDADDTNDQINSKDKEKMARIAALWHLMLGDNVQYDYRAHLSGLIGDDKETLERMVPEWQRRIFKAKSELRTIWKDLEKKGKGVDIVKGVGENGEEEWVELMERLLLMGLPLHVGQERNVTRGTTWAEDLKGIEHVPELI